MESSLWAFVYLNLDATIDIHIDATLEYELFKYFRNNFFHIVANVFVWTSAIPPAFLGRIDIIFQAWNFFNCFIERKTFFTDFTSQPVKLFRQKA